MEGIEAIVAGARSILDASLFARSDREARADVRAIEEAAAIVEAARLALIADLDTRPEAVPGARAGKVAQTFLNGMNLTRGQAGRDVEAARALEGPLPEVGAALAAGAITRAHVDVAVRTLTRVPSQFSGGAATDAVDVFLAEQARAHPPQAVDRIARDLLQRLDPEGSDRFDPDAYLRRTLTLTDASDGMMLIRGQVSGIAATWIRNTLEHLAAPDPAQEDEQGALVGDLRTRPQRLADALTDLCHRGPAGTATPAQVMVVATLDQAKAAADGRDDEPVGLADEVGSGRSISSRSLGQHLCAAVVRSLHHGTDGGLNLGRAQRLASARQKAVLIERDRGCLIPGCPVGAGTCDAHHIREWSEGGPTDLRNLGLLCGRHHTEVHLGIWRLEVRDGLPWAIPPPYYDPRQRPRRNTVHHAAEQTRRVATQLRLDIVDTG